MPLQLNEINPQSFPYQTQHKKAWFYRCSQIEAGCKDPIEKRGKTLFIPSMPTQSVSLLIKFHQSEHVQALNHPNCPSEGLNTLIAAINRISYQSNEKISVVIINNALWPNEISHINKTVRDYFKNSLHSIEIIEAHTIVTGNVGLFYDQVKDSLYLTSLSEDAPIFEATPVFNSNLTLLATQAIEQNMHTYAQKCSVTPEEIATLNDEQKIQLYFYSDEISQLIQHIPFNNLLEMEEYQRVTILDNADKMTICLGIYPDFLGDVLSLKPATFFSVIEVDDVITVLKAMKRSPNISQTERIELYSNVDELAYLITAGYAISDFNELSRETKEYLLKYAFELLRFSEQGLNVYQFMKLDEPLKEVLLNNWHKVLSLCSLITIQELIARPLSKLKEVLQLKEGPLKKFLDDSGITLKDFIAFDLAVQKQLLALFPTYKCKQIFELGLDVAEAINLPSAKLDLLLMGRHVVHFLLKNTSMNAKEMLNLDPNKLKSLIKKVNTWLGCKDFESIEQKVNDMRRNGELVLEQANEITPQNESFYPFFSQHKAHENRSNEPSCSHTTLSNSSE